MPVVNGKVVFAIKVRSDNDHVLEGTFSIRKPTIMDTGAISASLSRLNQGQPLVEPVTGAVLIAVANLSILVEDAPEWWEKVKEEENLPIIIAVHNMYVRERGLSPFRSAEILEASSNSAGPASDDPPDGEDI